MTMSKHRINFLVDTAIEVAKQEPALTPNSIATAMQWNQSSLTRALQCREVAFPERVGRSSLQQLVYTAFVQKDTERLEELSLVIERLSAAKTCELPESYLPVEEPEAEVSEDEDVDVDDEDEYSDI